MSVRALKHRQGNQLLRDLLHRMIEYNKKTEHECSFRNTLDAAWARRPLAVSQYDEQRVLVLVDQGGEPLNHFIQGLAVRRWFHNYPRRVTQARVDPQRSEALECFWWPPVTGQVWLTGFGIASHLTRERQSPEPWEFIAFKMEVRSETTVYIPLWAGNSHCVRSFYQGDNPRIGSPKPCLLDCLVRPGCADCVKRNSGWSRSSGCDAHHMGTGCNDDVDSLTHKRRS